MEGPGPGTFRLGPSSSSCPTVPRHKGSGGDTRGIRSPPARLTHVESRGEGAREVQRGVRVGSVGRDEPTPTVVYVAGVGTSLVVGLPLRESLEAESPLPSSRSTGRPPSLVAEGLTPSLASTRKKERKFPVVYNSPGSLVGLQYIPGRQGRVQDEFQTPVTVTPGPLELVSPMGLLLPGEMQVPSGVSESMSNPDRTFSRATSTPLPLRPLFQLCVGT